MDLLTEGIKNLQGPSIPEIGLNDSGKLNNTNVTNALDSVSNSGVAQDDSENDAQRMEVRI